MAQQVQAPRTFAQMGSKEFGQRGFQGAIFSPESRFSMNPGIGGDPRFKGPAGQPMIQRALMAAMGGPQNTLVQPSSPMGGAPIDGGLAGENEGGELEQLLTQMMIGQ
jgi:hypothetical protein